MCQVVIQTLDLEEPILRSTSSDSLRVTIGTRVLFMFKAIVRSLDRSDHVIVLVLEISGASEVD